MCMPTCDIDHYKQFILSKRLVFFLSSVDQFKTTVMSDYNTLSVVIYKNKMKYICP